MMHSDSGRQLDSVAHIVNGCTMYKGLYITRHDQIVNLIANTVEEVFTENVIMYKHSHIGPYLDGLKRKCFGAKQK